MGIVEEFNVSAADLRPDSELFKILNQLDRNKEVKYTIILGDKSILDDIADDTDRPRRPRLAQRERAVDRFIDVPVDELIDNVKAMRVMGTTGPQIRFQVLHGEPHTGLPADKGAAVLVLRVDLGEAETNRSRVH